ncbi:hypothetical protein K437DRAFT_187714 [Tilletiaria anomala UBC 951]|uniref:CS domain-containing protein n=1 Tax=Tilletiaria anomala (strain ATCC 24038 / CBS 436.72 / UBC 951) TaxID=1037660 RepID=A0A066WPL3_TILAU|nr:uncharacterized protein K437DRAFT_187714 [Tilletiaria anomala UBC 951]KDN52565.1 hypothetical protein K437DRAFT_187714 [Tilletiaria anomala UBC 951]
MADDSPAGFVVPPYEISQDSDHVYLSVRVPSSSDSSIAAATVPRVVSEDRAFGFVMGDYYLPLFLPAPVQNEPKLEPPLSGSSSSLCWSVTLRKANKGEHFEGLEDLQPQILPPAAVEALASASDAAAASAAAGNIDGNSGHSNLKTKDSDGLRSLTCDMLKRALSKENESRFLQGQPGLMLSTDDDRADDGITTSHRAEDANPLTSTSHVTATGPRIGYGFRRAHHEPLDPQAVECSRAYGLKHADPSSVPLELREKGAWDDEENKWDEGWYLENYLDMEGEITAIVDYTVQLSNPSAQATDAAAKDGKATVADEDLEALCLLWTLLFAYAYDQRTNFEDPTIESGWTISALSRPLCWFASPVSPMALAASADPTMPSAPQRALFAAVIASFRRSLCFPLYRHWALSLRVYTDVHELLKAGPGAVIEALQATHVRLMQGATGQRDDPMLNIFARVWLEPLLALLQQGDTAKEVVGQLLALLRALDTSNMHPRTELFKDYVGGGKWDLTALDEAAKEDVASGQQGGYV